MTPFDDTEPAAFVGRSHKLPDVTGPNVAKALEDFKLALVPGKDMDWLALAVSRALGITIKNKGHGPDRTSNSTIRAELERLASLARATWGELFECDLAVDSRLFTVAWRRWDGEGGNVSEPPEYRRYKKAIAELDWLSGFLSAAAKETPSQRGAWASAERKLIRIERGQYLAPIFEAAFGKAITVNNWPSDKEHKPSHFMFFYQRMVSLAFGEHETPDISGVLKEARKRHRTLAVQFGEQLIPGM